MLDWAFLDRGSRGFILDLIILSKDYNKAELQRFFILLCVQNFSFGFGLATPAKANLNSQQQGQVSACPTHTDLESAPGAHIRIKMML